MLAGDFNARTAQLQDGALGDTSDSEEEMKALEVDIGVNIGGRPRVSLDPKGVQPQRPPARRPLRRHRPAHLQRRVAGDVPGAVTSVMPQHDDQAVVDTPVVVSPVLMRSALLVVEVFS